MKHPSQWTKNDLHQHLQHALNLELWTIPLYLTALYSIRNLEKVKHEDYPEAAKLIYSVVVQEMLHLELVCNISNALGYPPKFLPPVYDERRGIPFIHPSKDYLPGILRGYSVKPQALNEDCLRLFCAIELPHPRKEMVWEKQKEYDSIAELYESLKIGIAALWDECYVGDGFNIKQKNTFNKYSIKNGRHHGFSQVVNSPETAMKAIEAVVEQGEGADSKRVPADFCPTEQEEEKNEIELYRDHLSHYQKFKILLHSYHKLPPVYLEKEGEKNSVAQRHLEIVFLSLLEEMQNSFSNNGTEMTANFWNKMTAFGNAITAVWESGACPHFNMSISQGPLHAGHAI